MKNILILGGNGYAGSSISASLSGEFDIVNYGSKQQDYNLLSKEEIRLYDYIILLAGHSSVRMCDGPLLGIWNNNVRNFNNLVEKMSHKQKLMYASSASVYGNYNTQISYKETFTNYTYVNNYDLTKISLDMLAKNHISEGKNIIGFRFGTINGASPVLRTDLMINAMTDNAINKGYIEVSNKFVKRPLLSTHDLYRALRQVIISDFVPGIYNLTSLNSNVDEISKTISNMLKVDIIDRGNTNTYNFTMDTDKFCHTFNFKFKDSLESITTDVIRCLKDKNTIAVKRNDYFDYRG